MNSILAWLIPVSAGAVIGFVTNALAIKMLFRPLNKIKLFGIPIPFTPGILPRERHTLAENIGGMVERELLTAEILRRRLESPGLQAKLRASVADFTGQVLASPPGSWDGFFKAALPLAEGAYPQAARALITFLKKEEIRRKLELQGSILLNQTIQKLNPLQRLFITAGQYDKTLDDSMPAIIEDLITQIEGFLSDNDTKRRIMEHLEGGFFNALGMGTLSAGEFFQADAAKKERLDAFLTEKLLSLASGQIEKILAAVDVRTLVVERIDSLDMIKVEGIILDVMGRQLWWINVFGAILGALIGLSQVLLAHLL